MIITLLGYMASGKSFVGKKLAEVLEYKFVDLDAYIEEKEQKSIQEIFETKGEIYFRKIESTYIRDLVSKDTNCLLALGGGTPCYANTMHFLLEQKHVHTVYLQVSINSIVERLQKETTIRPLVSHLKSQEDLLEFIGKHLFERLQFYNQASYTIDANKQLNTIIEAIVLKLF